MAELIGWMGAGRFKEVVFVTVSRGCTIEIATRCSDGQRVYLKSTSSDASHTLHQEYAILSALRSDHVLRVDELIVGPTTTTLVAEGFFAMPFGLELRGKRVPLAEALRIGREIATALGAVHLAGFVHQNVSPMSIVRVPETGMMKLISFDLAVAIGAMASGEAVGSLGYLSPEQTGRLGRPLDGRSDLYALGATLFELISGQQLFGTTDAVSLVHAHLATRPRRIDDVVRDVPSIIGDILERLLTKSPDQRYQSAATLIADLTRCEIELAATGTIEPFAIASSDTRAHFAFPDRLYGRADQVSAITDAFASLARGGVETVLVSGNVGVGKSSVVREAHHPIVLAGGRFVAGKFEQLYRDIPFSAILVALGELVAQLLTDPTLDALRGPLSEALGETAPLVCVQLPSLEFIIGARVRDDELSPDVAQRLLAEGLVRFVRFFARKSRPLALFLDNVQWADSGSLSLLKRLVTTDAAEALLVIGAYRDDEVDLAHPVSLAVADYAREGATLVRIEIVPLGVEDTAALIADTLRTSAADVARLAPLVWRKTEGNAFYIKQFLSALHEEGHLQFDRATGSLRVNDAALSEASVTDNVADLLARKIGKLPPATRDVLAGAAALGTTFDLSLLAAIVPQPGLELEASLAAAVIAGMITLAPSSSAAARYAFAHERIQVAAYTALDDAARERLHLAIGRQLAASPDATLFDVVHHLNQGRALLEPGVEQQQFIALASQAAQQARRAGAFDVALTMAASAASLCRRDHDVAAWFACSLSHAELLGQAGRHLEARVLLAKMRSHVAGAQLAAVDTLDTTACLSLGQMSDALTCGLRASAILGLELPADPAERTTLLDRLVSEIRVAADATPVARWIEHPVMTDPLRLAQMSLLMAMIPASYQQDPALFALISATMSTISLRSGNCGISARGYAAFSIELWNRGDLDFAYRMGRLGVDLVRHLDATEILPSVDFTHAMFASPWRRPLAETIDRLTATIASGIEAGDVVHSAYAAFYALNARMVHGHNLSEIADEAVRYVQLCERFGFGEVAASAGWYVKHAAALAIMDGIEGAFEYAIEDRRLTEAQDNVTSQALFRCLEQERRYWCGDHVGVLEISRQIHVALPHVPAREINAQFRMYACLSALEVGDASPVYATYQRELAAYAEACAHNFGHMSVLIEAEQARLAGSSSLAIDRYEQALDAANDAGFTKIAALANELAARFWLLRKRPAFATVHLEAAARCCTVWGAHGRAQELVLRRRAMGVASASSTHAEVSLDFETALKASHAIASDLVLDSLLVKMMAFIGENTGAQSGAIILDVDGELRVRAALRDGKPCGIPGGLPISQADDVCEGIVMYTTRTNENVVLEDASRHPTFRADPYVRLRRPRSVLCIPISHNEGVTGVVYLENNLVSGAFTLARLAALGLLTAQLAISVENATMVANLESLVAERTRELTAANQRLREEASARESMEQELRLGQKLQSVGQLAAGIAHEINTPIQFIGDNITFLRGGIDSMITLVEAYREAIDPVTQSIDVAAVRHAEEVCDLAYVQENAREACELAATGVSRVARIVEAMRSFSHPDRVEQSYASVNAGLETTLVVAHNAYRHVADVVTDLGGVPEVLCHAGELNQVFLNLIVNAADAIDDVYQRTRIRGTITIRTACEDGMLLVEIADTGDGIPSTLRDRVFDPFFTTKAVGKGTGQGLSLARTTIVERHGGSLAFACPPTGGTRFTIRLPMHAVAVLDATG